MLEDVPDLEGVDEPVDVCVREGVPELVPDGVKVTDGVLETVGVCVRVEVLLLVGVRVEDAV